MWKAPNRPRHEISQTYNDGIVQIYTAENRADPGYQPVEELRLKISLGYEEQRLGIHRAYLARQNLIRVERVIRVPLAGNVTTQDVAVTEDGQRYRIDLAQVAEGVYPPSVDLTLAVWEPRREETGYGDLV